MLQACFQPKTSLIASLVFDAIHSYSDVASDIVGGMAFHFKGINKDYLVKQAKRFKGIDLTRYEYYIDLYANGLRKIYNKKEDKNG